MLPHLLHDMFLCHKDEVLPGRLIEHLEGRGDGSIGGVVIACISKALHVDKQGLHGQGHVPTKGPKGKLLHQGGMSQRPVHHITIIVFFIGEGIPVLKKSSRRSSTTLRDL